jgi:hypothetical protein
MYLKEQNGEGCLIFNEIIAAFQEENLLVDNYDISMLQLNHNCIELKKFTGFLKEKITAKINFPEKLKAKLLTDSQIRQFIGTHIGFYYKDKNMMYVVYKINLLKKDFVLLFEYSNTNYCAKDTIIYYNNPFYEYLVDFVYKPQSMFIYDCNTSELLYKAKVSCPLITYNDELMLSL